MSRNLEKIKITITCTREVAAELNSAVTFYAGCTNDDEDEDEECIEDDERRIKGIIKIGNTFENAVTFNKTIDR
jgi:hypothetical protein